jgi:hypothetical protein
MAIAGCGDDEGGIGAGPDASADPDGATACSVTPGAWSAPSFAANAATALALRGQLDTLAGTTMRGAEQETVVVDEVSDLTALYEAGSPSLSVTVSAGFDAITNDAFADFVALVLAGQQDLVDDGGNWTPGTDGGIFGAGTRGINTGGLEVRQIVDKGLFGGGLLYGHAIGLTEGTITEATIDAIAAAWGSNDLLGTDDRTDSANYGFAMGFHAEIAQALTDAKAYAADGECSAERDAALVSAFRAWELSLLARTVFYANAAAAELATAVDDDARASGLHELAEGLGLALGFYGLSDPSGGPLSGAGRIISDADIEAIMTALGVNVADLSASTTGEFVADPSGFAAGVTAVEARVIQIYGITQSEIQSYRTPTQG